MQLVELQRIVPRLEAAGYALYAVSYDRVPRLAAFAEQHEIGYPLLADFGSTWIRRLGMLNDRVAEEHGRYGIAPRPSHRGVAHPGLFVLDREGRVRESRFYESYRERDTGSTVLGELLGVAPSSPEATSVSTDDVVRVRAWLDRPAWSWYQRNRLHLTLDIAPGWHVYVPPVPDGYVPLGVTVDAPAGVAVGAPVLPQGGEHRLEGLEERFLTIEGQADVATPVTFAVERGSGAVRLTVGVEYQACDDRTCLPPSRVSAEVVVPEAPPVE